MNRHPFFSRREPDGLRFAFAFKTVFSVLNFKFACSFVNRVLPTGQARTKQMRCTRITPHKRLGYGYRLTWLPPSFVFFSN